ncbi:MAG TPA: hypothetical protein ENJ80_07090 [Gammaproteobacteria bacterium]|nr:hypothetical protein [Gammaproteobacteria bacterium]
MSKRLLQFLLLGLWLAAPAGSFAATLKPQQVQDLHYGEVLFHFYQEDYFSAITRLMMAQQQEQLEHHRDESELLLGGMQLSYGMLNQAESRFDRLLDKQTDAELRNRVWYYLTKISYQRGHFNKAHEILQEIDKPRDKTMRAELAVLGANINMALGNNTEAAEGLKKTRAPEGLEEYLRINRGIALLRAGNIEEGRKTLDKLGKQGVDTEELRALRDRANLGLGYEMLRAGDAESARKYLNRVRLQGPFEQAALLGAGWADAELGDYEQALTPWLELLKQTEYAAPVQEAHLAVPYAFAKLGDRDRSIYFYEQAISYFDDEQRQLDEAIEAVQSGSLLALLGQADTGTSGGWLHDNPTLEGVPSGRYLVDILSGHNFQESLKDYRDLGYLEQLLNYWQGNINLYYDMVDARRLAYEERSPQIRARLDLNEPAALQARWQNYQDLVRAEHISSDPLKLATGKEKQHWEMLQRTQEKLATLPDEPRYAKMRDKARWLQGVLYWQVQDDYKARLWETEKALAGLEISINNAVHKHAQVTAALDKVRAGFDGYDQRIETLRARILGLQPQIHAARGSTSEHLQRLALEELVVRKQRLASYRSQARYALARSYDQVAQHDEEQP